MTSQLCRKSYKFSFLLRWRTHLQIFKIQFGCESDSRTEKGTMQSCPCKNDNCHDAGDGDDAPSTLCQNMDS